MTEAERDDLIDLYIDDTLPEALHGFAEAYLASHPESAAEAAALKRATRRLQAITPDKPDDWFVERTLDRLLREHSAAQDSQTEQIFHTR
jgi:anti-sigma factor RsiW